MIPTTSAPVFTRMAALSLLSLVMGMPAWTGCVMGGGDAGNQNANTPPVSDVDQSLSNRPPVAVAGPDVTVQPGDLVTLNATGSSDPDNDQLTFIWQQVEGSPEIEFQSTRFSSIVSFTAPLVTSTTTLRLSLAVSDGFAARFDEVLVTVTP